MKKLISVCLFIILFKNCPLISSYNDHDANIKVNTLNLLIPQIYEDIALREIRYYLKAYNGCYKWQLSNDENLKLTQIMEQNQSQSDCFSNAIVELKSNFPPKEIIWIFAKEQESGETIKIESRIEPIKRIEIMTKLRVIEVGDIQVLEVLGFDKENNLFSTLEGVKFNWKILNNDGNLQIVSIKDSLIKATKIRKKLEQQQFYSDIILIKGLKTGKVSIRVQLNELNYSIKDHIVDIKIIQRFKVFPDNKITLMPLNTLQLEVAQLRKQNHIYILKGISLDEKNYKFKIKNSSLATINDKGYLQVNELLGQTEIIVEDSRIDGNFQSIELIVSQPQDIDLLIRTCQAEDCWEQSKMNLNFQQGIQKIQFDNNWNMIKNSKYYIRVVLYDRSRLQFFKTKDFQIKFDFDHKSFKLIEGRNHELLLIPIKNTKSRKIFKSSFTILQKDLSCEKEYEIFNRVKTILPQKEIVLPLYKFLAESQQKPQQQFLLYSLGGSGTFEYFSKNKTVFQVNSQGLITPIDLGHSLLIIKDKKNKKNFEEVPVQILELGRITFLEKQKEMLIDSLANIYPIVLSLNFEKRFSNCSNLKFDILDFDQQILEVETLDKDNYLDELNYYYETNQQFQNYVGNSTKFNKQIYKDYLDNQEISLSQLMKIYNQYNNFGICSKVEIKSQRLGQYQLKMQLRDYQNKENQNQSSMFSESFFLRIHSNLQSMHIQDPRDNKKNEIVLTQASSFIWKIRGGPEIWDNNPNQMKKSIRVFQNNQVTHQPLLQIKDQSFVHSNQFQKQFELKFLVQKHFIDQSYVVEYLIQNSPNEKLIFPLVLNISLKISCKLPSEFRLVPFDLNQNTFDYVWKSQKTNLLRENMNYSFKVVAIDENQQIFYNFSTLSINCYLQNHQNLHSIALKTLKNSNIDFINQIELDEYKNLSIRDFVGKVKVIIQSIKFEDFLLSQQILSISSFQEFEIRKNAEIYPQSLVLYYSKQNVQELRISHGSGVFSIKEENRSMAQYLYNQKAQILVIYPLNIGFYEIFVEDSIMFKSNVVKSQISIELAFKIEIVPEKTLVQTNEELQIQIKVYTKENQEFSINQFKFINLNLELISDNSLDDNNQYFRIERNQLFQDLFSIKGSKPGNFKFIASILNQSPNVTLNQQKVLSEVVEIYIYDQIYLEPSEIYLSPGCRSYIEIKGGPNQKQRDIHQISIEFKLDNDQNIKIFQLKDTIFEIHALEVGNNSIDFQLIQNQIKKIDSKSIDVEIGLVNNVEISNLNNNQIFHVNASFRLNARPKISKYYLTLSLCPFKYIWSTQFIEKIHISSNFDNFKDFSSKFDIHTPTNIYDPNIGTNFTTYKTGSSEIYLKTVLDYPLPYKKYEITTNYQINIIDPLDLEKPSYIQHDYTRTSSLILPPLVRYQLNPNKNQLKFQVLYPKQNNLINITDSGKLSIGNNRDQVIILIENQLELNKNENLVLALKIVDIHFILVENSHKIQIMPTESESELKIQYLDSFGRLFPFGMEGIELKISILNPLLLSAEQTKDNHLKLRSKQTGVTSISVSLKGNSQIQDTFIICIGSVISPTFPIEIHIGGYVQFEVLAKSFPQTNQWSTSNEETAKIHPKTGLLQGLKEGKTIVFFKEFLQYAREIKVFKLTHFQELKKNQRVNCTYFQGQFYMTNIQHHKQYQKQYRLCLQAQSEDKVLTKLWDIGQVNNNLRFSCESQYQNLLQIYQEVYQDKNGNQYPICIIRPKKYYPKNQILPESLFLQTKLYNNIDNQNITYINQEFHFKFDWAFTILNSTEIEIYSNNLESNIKIQSPKELIVKSDNEIFNQFLQTNFIPGSHLFWINITMVQQIFTENTQIELEIENPTTNQLEKIYIYIYPNSIDEKLPIYNNSDDKDQQENYFFNDYYLLLIGAVIFLVFLFISFQTSKAKQLQNNESNRKKQFFPNNFQRFQQQNQFQQYMQNQGNKPSFNQTSNLYTPQQQFPFSNRYQKNQSGEVVDRSRYRTPLRNSNNLINNQQFEKDNTANIHKIMKGF